MTRAWEVLAALALLAVAAPSVAAQDDVEVAIDETPESPIQPRVVVFCGDDWDGGPRTCVDDVTSHDDGFSATVVVDPSESCMDCHVGVHASVFEGYGYQVTVGYGGYAWCEHTVGIRPPTVQTCFGPSFP